MQCLELSDLSDLSACSPCLYTCDEIVLHVATRDVGGQGEVEGALQCVRPKAKNECGCCLGEARLKLIKMSNMKLIFFSNSFFSLVFCSLTSHLCACLHSFTAYGRQGTVASTHDESSVPGRAGLALDTYIHMTRPLSIEQLCNNIFIYVAVSPFKLSFVENYLSFRTFFPFKLLIFRIRYIQSHRFKYVYSFAHVVQE